MSPTITTTKPWMTRVPSVSIVSARFCSSMAESSWAVPSVASRSNSADTTPRTSSRTARTASRPAIRMIRIGPTGSTTIGHRSSGRIGTA
jgi:hypothetical protein